MIVELDVSCDLSYPLHMYQFYFKSVKKPNTIYTGIFKIQTQYSSLTPLQLPVRNIITVAANALPLIVFCSKSLISFIHKK